MLGDDNFADERGLRRGPGFGGSSAESHPGSRQYTVQADGWAGGGEDQPILDLAVYWRLALKHRILILGCFFGALVVGAALTLLMTPIYTAKATLQIDREAARVFNSTDVTPSESLIQGEEFFQTQYGLLRSRSLAERVIESLGLANSDAALKAIGIEPPEARATAAAQAARRRA
ncbi:MAG TPA: Wzz/FepE/Etk N-terminal domain-containing protein, partial [Brevundimonas sp.]|nr:Wzz/FepE/Etk N-terminal domain-containing protein [Brevundimonas sp.]